MFCLFAFTFVFQKNIPYAVYKYFYILSLLSKWLAHIMAFFYVFRLRMWQI